MPFRICCALSFPPALMPSQSFTISRMLLSLMKTNYRNLSCLGERSHWNASRWGELLTNLRVSSLTFGFSRLVLATYHGPYSRAGAVGTVVKGRPSWRSSQSGLGTYQQGGRGGPGHWGPGRSGACAACGGRAGSGLGDAGGEGRTQGQEHSA